MKLCFIASHLFTGGFTTSLLNMIEQCKGQGIEVSLMLLEPTKNQFDISNAFDIRLIEPKKSNHKKYDIPLILRLKKQKIVYEELLKKIEVTSGDLKRKLQNSYYQQVQYDIVKNQFETVDLREYDAVISWEEQLCDYYLANKVKAKKKIAYIHPNYKQAMFDSSIDDEMIRKVDYVVGVSEASIATLKEVFPEHANKFKSVYNPLNLARVDQLEKEKISFKSNDSFTILTVARLDLASKAFDRVIRVVKQLELCGYAFEWYVCGDGVDRKRIERMIQEADIHHLHLLGNQVNPYPFMKQADVFVLLSNYEGKPVVVDEAMYLDLPCIVTNYDSAMEQIEDGVNGFVVPMDDEACFKAIEKVITESCVRDTFKENLRKQDKKKYADISSFIKLIEK